tara:strand:- start:13020 stop:13844 length:825 start_codon:yes stop_codon:yes gene_type:complete
MSTKDLDKPKGTDISTDIMDDIFENAGEGAAFAAEDMIIPRINLLQKTSDQCEEEKPQYLKEARPGMFFNTLTGALVSGDEGLSVVPCYSVTSYTEWVPESKGGGIVGTLDPTDLRLLKTTRNGSTETFDDNGNEMWKTDEWYCLQVEKDGTYNPIIVGMKKSALKVSKRWKTQIAMQTIEHPKTGRRVKPPLYGTIWKLTSVGESNKEGKSWKNWSVEKVGLVSSRELLQDAKTLRASIVAGEAKAAPEDENKAVGDQGSSPDTSKDGDKIPF